MNAMQHDELAAWLQLVHAEGVGPDAVRRLLAAFGLPQHILDQSLYALQQVVTQRQAEAVLHPQAATRALVDATWQWLQAGDGTLQRRVLTLACPDYPASLLDTADPPVVLYALGQLQWLGTQPAIAMVGSRNPTPQGASNARQFARSFAGMGWTVVSGLALGVDAAAHEGALTAAGTGGAATVAVVGTGIDRVYPRQHRELAHRIAQHGLLLSECPLGAPPLAHHFPRRNRILAGISQGVLVVEAAPQSGSLITARMGSEQGKEVFAIPGSIHSPQSRGCHALIRQGAKLVESAEDVLEELRPGLPRPAVASTAAPAAPADPVLQALGYDPVGLDALLARTGMDTPLLQARLLQLELDGWVARLPGGLYQRTAQA